jgi:hypothetical protein
MSVMAAAVVRELGMMHLVAGSETYKTASGVVTQALGRIDEVTVRVGGVMCVMTFMVVDIDSYDVLLGLDFLMKIGAIVDVERGLIQVRKGPGTDVEVLPLTIMNLLQRMSSGALVQEESTTWKNTHANGDSGWMPDRDQAIVTKEDDPSTSDSDIGTDSSEYYDSESNQLKQIDCEDEFGDTELEELVSSEGPQEILRLMLQEQADGFMAEEVTNADDYTNWIRWVSDAEQSRQDMCESTYDAPVPFLLQQPNRDHDSSILALLHIVQIKDGNSDCKPTEQLASSSHHEMDIKWREICQRIKIDTALDEEGQRQL